MRWKTLGVGLLAAAMTALAGMATAQAQTASTCTVSSADQSVDASEQALLDLINQYRRDNAKPASTMHATVTRPAAWFSRDMATRNYFPANHVDADGRTVAQRLTWCGVSYSTYAENICAGAPDTQSVFSAWRNSGSHNANLLRDGVAAAGIARAYASTATYGWYWTLDLTNSTAVTATTTTTTRAATTTTTTTTRPVATTTTTRPAGPVPGSPEWWQQYYASRT